MEFNGLAFLLWLLQQPAGPIIFGGFIVLLTFRWTLRRLGF